MSRCWWRWMKTFSLVHCMSHSLIQHQGNVQEVSTGTFLLNMKYCTTDIYRLQRTAFWGFLRAIQKITGWWFGTWMLWLPFSWECHHPNWRSPSFVIGVGQPPTRIDSPYNPYNPYNPYSPCTIHYTELYNHLNQIIKRALIYVHSEGHRSRHIFLGGCFSSDPRIGFRIMTSSATPQSTKAFTRASALTTSVMERSVVAGCGASFWIRDNHSAHIF